MKAQDIKGMRIAAFDYGKKRIGFAVCDEFHITINPRKCFDRESKNLWIEIIKTISEERISLIIVGVPYRLDEIETELIQEIKLFISQLKEKTNLNVIEYDESYTSKQAVKTMLEIGKRKKARAVKQNKDLIAAALILKGFLHEIES